MPEMNNNAKTIKTEVFFNIHVIPDFHHFAPPLAGFAAEFKNVNPLLSSEVLIGLTFCNFAL